MPSVGTGLRPNNANMGDPAPALCAVQPGSGQSAGGGTARLTDDFREGRPTTEYAPGTSCCAGSSPGTRPVPLPTTREGRPEIACH